MIGIFDSGLGGLTVLKAVAKELPGYPLLYLGDTARSPYGNRSQDLIYQFTQEAVDYLFKQGCELVIIACNTASAEALRRIQQEWLPKNYPDKRVLGVIRPVAEEAIKVTRSGRISVLGTRATILSKAFEREIKALRPTAKVFGVACPLLVPLIEEGFGQRAETKKIMRNYVRPLKQQKIDTLILGCTHYAMLYKSFKAIAGKNIIVLDSSVIVAKKLKEYLKAHPEIDEKIIKNKKNRFLVTDLTDNFKLIAENWLSTKIDLEKVEL
ncbi:MAG: glutamate racemase [Candidatus Buchananbacteria bacterium]